MDPSRKQYVKSLIRHEFFVSAAFIIGLSSWYLSNFFLVRRGILNHIPADTSNIWVSALMWFCIEGLSLFLGLAAIAVVYLIGMAFKEYIAHVKEQTRIYNERRASREV